MVQVRVSASLWVKAWVRVQLMLWVRVRVSLWTWIWAWIWVRIWVRVSGLGYGLGYGLGHGLRHGLGYGIRYIYTGQDSIIWQTVKIVRNTIIHTVQCILYSVTPFYIATGSGVARVSANRGDLNFAAPLIPGAAIFCQSFPKFLLTFCFYPKSIFPSFQILKCRLYFPPLKVPLGGNYLESRDKMC